MRFLLTTQFAPGELKSPDLLRKADAARQAYRQASLPSFYIVSSHVVSGDRTVDIVEADSVNEVEEAAAAIAKATDTKVSIDEMTPFSRVLTSLA
jgi:hypothetical protein